MTILSVLSAVLCGLIRPIAIPSMRGISNGYAAMIGDATVVAVTTDSIFSQEERNEVLHQAAHGIALRNETDVWLTDDVLVYLSLKRMQIRRVDDEERRILASRLAAVKDRLYHASPENEGKKAAEERRSG